MLEFTWPWVFLILPLPLLIYRVLSRAPRQEAALYVPFFSVLSRLQSENENLTSGRLLNLILCTLIWILLVLAASRPQWLGEPVQLPSTGRDLMLSVDISGSMEAQDIMMCGDGRSKGARGGAREEAAAFIYIHGGYPYCTGTSEEAIHSLREANQMNIPQPAAPPHRP